MSLKNIILLIILLIILGVGGWWVATNYRPPTIEDREEIFNLLTELRDATNIGFSDIDYLEFTWHTKQGEQIVQGKGFEATRISDEQFISIATFFADKGF